MPHAFLSYTRFDDDYLNGGISALKVALEKAVQARTGEPFRIFQDVDDIKPGDPWRKKLDQAIQAAQLFIPVLTPNFFTSNFCRREAKAFLDYEARAGRNDLVLPIYLIDAPLMNVETRRERDDLANQLHDRQYSDWRTFGFQLKADETRSHIHDLAGAIALAIARTNTVEKGPVVPTAGVEEQIAKLNKEIVKLDEALTVEQEKTRLLEIELSERKGEVKQLAEEASAIQGQLEEAIAAKDESESLKKLRERLSLLDQALKKERAKTKALTKDLEASEDKAEQLTIERTILEGEAHEAKTLGQKVQRLERQLQQKQSDMTKAAELAKANKQSLLGEMALLKSGQETSRRDKRVSQEDRIAKERPKADGQLIGSFKSMLVSVQEIPGRLISWVADFFKELAGMVTALTVALLAVIGGIWLLSKVSFGPSPGTTFKDCDECPEMVVLPVGKFLMGASEDVGLADERPQREVTIASPFALAKYEVSFAEWDACVAAGGCNRRPADNEWGREDRPVINVSWMDAQQYVDWLSEKTGASYRLPSEAEWEYGARAGTTTNYSWGHSVGQNKANCSLNYCGEGFETTAPVGSFLPNALGLFDVHGNVWEWVQDVWHKDYTDARRDQNARISENVAARVKLGGAWNSNPSLLRSSNRDWGSIDTPKSNTGFRIAKTL